MKGSRLFRMTDMQQGISVGRTPDGVYIRVVGRGTFQNSQPLRHYALDCIQRGHQQFIVDLGACPVMDSTFLGVLAGIGLRLRRGGSNATQHVNMVNVSNKNAVLIHTLGLDQLLSVQVAADEAAMVPLPSNCHLERLPESDIDHQTKPLDRNETTNLMLNSHENLIAADEHNAPRFEQVTKYLREEASDQDNAEH